MDLSLFSKRKHLGEFHDETSSGGDGILGSRETLLVVDDEQIAEWVVHDIETDVGVHFVTSAVVLYERVEEHVRRERVVGAHGPNARDKIHERLFGKYRLRILKPPKQLESKRCSYISLFFNNIDR